MKILFIGAGNMGSAIIGGICDKVMSKDDIYVYEINQTARDTITNKYGIHSIDGFDNIGQFDLILFAIKPQVFVRFACDNAKTFKDKLSADNTIVTIMAGISIDKIQNAFGKIPTVRVMPNTPALVGESMSVLACSPEVDSAKMDFVKKIFDSIGKTQILDESYLNAVTGLSGSGPAYVYMFIEALTAGGILSGLAKPLAEELAVQTVKGTIAMIEHSKDNTVEELRHAVTSPGGTTIAGLAKLEECGMRNAVIQAVKAATDRSEQLGKK